MDGKFDDMYMNHPDNKHDECAEEKIEIEKPTKVQVPS